MKERLDLIKYLEEYKEIYSLSYDSSIYIEQLIQSLKDEELES